jgi:3-oxoacyl-[acyl-carrier protein] reductase
MLKNILITGSTKGLGKALAETFLKNNYNVGINYSKDDQAFNNFLKENYQYSNQILKLKADIRDLNQVNLMFNTFKEKLGNIDILINNAGITLASTLSNTDNQEFEDIIDINLLGTIHCFTQAEKLMKQNKTGHILNIASLLALKGTSGASAYSMSKNAIVDYSKQKAKELGDFNIKVNIIFPGFLETNLTKDLDPKIKQKAINDNILNRISTPKKVAKFIYNICQTEDISGQVFNLDSRMV